MHKPALTEMLLDDVITDDVELQLAFTELIFRSREPHLGRPDRGVDVFGRLSDMEDQMPQIVIDPPFAEEMLVQ